MSVGCRAHHLLDVWLNQVQDWKYQRCTDTQWLTFHLNKLYQLWVINHVNFIQKNDQGRNPYLSCEQYVFSCLGHGAVSCWHYEDGAVHLVKKGFYRVEKEIFGKVLWHCIVLRKSTSRNTCWGRSLKMIPRTCEYWGCHVQTCAAPVIIFLT